jgi:hypothetical protein
LEYGQGLWVVVKFIDQKDIGIHALDDLGNRKNLCIARLDIGQKVALVLTAQGCVKGGDPKSFSTCNVSAEQCGNRKQRSHSMPFQSEIIFREAVV